MTYTLQQMFLCVSLAVYLTTSVIMAVVRWGHKCAPYADQVDYYFPGWRTLVFGGLSNLFLLPVLFFPEDPDALLQLRTILLLASPVFCSVLIYSYFGRVLKLTWWKKPAVIMSTSYAVMSAGALVTTLLPGTQMEGMFRSVYFLVAGALATFYLVALVFAILMIIQPLSRFSEESFSNPDDFPEQYARSLIFIPLLHLVMSWSATFNGSLPVMSFALLMLSILLVVLLLGALSPHRTLEATQLEQELDAVQTAESTEEAEQLTPDRKEEILRAIRFQVEDEQACLDSHLTLGKLSQMCGVNRTYVSGVLNENLGGFFNYVNRCRLEHAEAYKKEHPTADMDEVALLSGFNSRQSYYNARKKLNN
jgi:AraC-like DNA-binding protein